MPSAAENLKANFRASECRAELVRAMPSAAENLEEEAVQSAAIVTGDEVLGIGYCYRPAWKAGSTPAEMCQMPVLWRSASSLRFSAALGNSSKLDCARLHENLL